MDKCMFVSGGFLETGAPQAVAKSELNISGDANAVEDL